MKLAETFTPKIQINKTNHDPKIGIIIRKSEQKRIFREVIKKRHHHQNVNIYHIDQLIGLEKDIIIVGLINESDILYLSQLNRLNMALTRAKYAVFIVGFSSLFEITVRKKHYFKKFKFKNNFYRT